ncbi:MAG: PHP domain-containing protein, partial [Novosphingobium sp.]
MAHERFVPLRVFSSYTMLDGTIEPKAAAKLAKHRAFPAIAITDRNGLYGAMSFAGACKDSGIQPLIGTFLAVAREDGAAGKDPVIDWLGLIAQNETGWNNLCHLVSRAHLGRPIEFEPHVTMADLDGHTDGLIALTGAGEGALVRLLAAGKGEAAVELCARLEALFPDRLYLEVARRNDPAEEAAEDALID